MGAVPDSAAYSFQAFDIDCTGGKITSSAHVPKSYLFFELKILIEKQEWERKLISKTTNYLSSGCCYKYHRLSGLNNRHLCLSFLELGKFQVKGATRLSSGWVFSSWLVNGHLVSSHGERDPLSHLLKGH